VSTVNGPALWGRARGCYTARVALPHDRRLAAGAFLLAALAALAAHPAPCPAAGSVSTVSPRPMSMGGAFLAVEDGVVAMAWNPAGLTVPLCRGRTRVRVHANVLGAASIARETGLLTGVESEEFSRLPAAERAVVALGSAAKAVAFRRGALCAGVLLLEEELDPGALARSTGLADASDLLSGCYHCAAVSFMLAPTVSIGASHTFFAGFDAAGERVYGSGRAYGALLHPNDSIAFALTYYDASSGFERARTDLEGFAPGTMNAGVAWRPAPEALLTLDVRDLSEKVSDTALEPRVGLAWDAGRVSLRAGAFGEQDGDDGVLTLGLGAIPMDGCRGVEPPRGDAHVVNYALLLSRGDAPKHLLSVLLRF